MCGYAIQDFDQDVHSTAFPAFAGSTRTCFRPRRSSKRRTIARGSSRSALLEQRARPVVHQPAVRVGSRSRAVAASTIYVIDDDASMRRSLARLLSAVNLQVQTFQSAEEFLAAVAPGLGGLPHRGRPAGRHERLRAAEPHGQRELAHAGHRDERLAPIAQIESEAVRLGASAFLRKPFDAQALLDAIARALTRE